MRKISFPPIVNSDSRILILGTMPGEKSLHSKQYYANKSNQFWRIISFITEEDILSRDYNSKISLLLKHKIAIWDVLMHCQREGSLDINISDEAPNDFTSFFYKYPNIIAVYFNGASAENMFAKYKLRKTGLAYELLPSTSSMNTSMTCNEKAEYWKERIRFYL